MIQEMVRGLFILYFALIHTVGLLSAVLGSEEVNFLTSFQILVCYAEKTEPNPDAISQGTHHHGHHEHPHSHETDHHQAEKSPDVPFIHCNPIPIDSVSALLFIPFEMPEALSSFHPAGPDLDVPFDNLPLPVRHPLPLTPPPRDSLS